MPYKYFKYPKRNAVFTEVETPCQICNTATKCLDAVSFYSEEELEAICETCLSAGRLAEINAFTNDADVEQLFNQLEALHPDTPKEELLQEAKAKTDELEMRTPPLISWQDWKFPALDGDYCEFVCFASQQDYNTLAEDGDGKAFFEKTLLDELREYTDVDAIWNTLPERKIKTVAQSNEFPLLAYLFKSLHSEQHLTIWDIC